MTNKRTRTEYKCECCDCLYECDYDEGFMYLKKVILDRLNMSCSCDIEDIDDLKQLIQYHLLEQEQLLLHLDDCIDYMLFRYDKQN
jgi:hypothetical protein